MAAASRWRLPAAGGSGARAPSRARALEAAGFGQSNMGRKDHTELSAANTTASIQVRRGRWGGGGAAAAAILGWLPLALLLAARRLACRVPHPTPSTAASRQVLGVGADTGCSVPSALLFFDRQRYLFNAGEGFQRFCVEHRVKLSKVSGVLATRTTTEATGGLPGGWVGGWCGWQERPGVEHQAQPPRVAAVGPVRVAAARRGCAGVSPAAPLSLGGCCWLAALSMDATPSMRPRALPLSARHAADHGRHQLRRAAGGARGDERVRPPRPGHPGQRLPHLCQRARHRAQGERGHFVN